jgi:hypothetical protein
MQNRAMRESATRRGWTITMQMKEVGSGASQRQMREKLIEAARRRDIDVALVWRLDRWGRSVTDLLATLQELQLLGFGFVSLTEALHLTTAAPWPPCAPSSPSTNVKSSGNGSGPAHTGQNGRMLGRPLTAGIKADKIRKLYRSGQKKLGSLASSASAAFACLCRA